jgi:uncharacterized protein YaaR (DUF327 family)
MNKLEELDDSDILWLETAPTSAEPMYKASKKKYFEAIQNYPYKSHSIDQGLNDSERKNYAVLFNKVKELNEKLEEMKEEIEYLKKENEELINQLEKN